MLPAGLERPTLGPVSSGLGEVLHYIVRRPGVDLSQLSTRRRVEELTELRTVQDWIIKPQLAPRRVQQRSIVGEAMRSSTRFGLSRIVSSDTKSRSTRSWTRSRPTIAMWGVAVITQNSQMLLVHGVGRTVTIGQIESIVVTAKNGVPIRVRDVADVEIGHEIRRGAVTADGRGEVVYGLGFMLMGENSHKVTYRLKEKVEDIRTSLPPGVEMLVVYDRTELVDHVIDTVRQNLFEGGLLVIAVLFVVPRPPAGRPTGSRGYSFVAAVRVPGMVRFGIAASLLSLGAIDFGLVVDSSVVMMENCVRQLARGIPPGRRKLTWCGTRRSKCADPRCSAS